MTVYRHDMVKLFTEWLATMQEVKEKFKCARAECAELHLKEIEKRVRELQ